MAIIVAALVAGTVGFRLGAAGPASGVINSDIESLRSHPEELAGKLVRISGKLDECYEWECSLCPESMSRETANPKECMPLEFRALMPGTGFGEEDQEKVFRFSSVTLTAKFDPTCWKVPCMDRPVVLSDADVVSVQKRRSSSDGLWLGRVTALQPASSALAIVIGAEANHAGFPPAPMKVFAVKGDAGTAIVCWTTAGTTSWPSSLEGALSAKSTADFYGCNKARKVVDRWVIQPRW
ncbi:MAG: hypothetical protein ABI454_02930 [Sphingomicrobium sp.]